MYEAFTTLAEDIDQKFKDLCSIHDHPTLYLCNYFDELRNRIDIDAETILYKLAVSRSKESEEESSSKAYLVNEQRSNFIRILRNMEESLRELLPADRTTTDRQAYASLGQRIEEFRQSLDNGGKIRETEDAYVSLADELFDQSSQLEARLFGNQTIVYQNGTEGELGCLFYWEHGHLNKVELNVLR